MRFIKYGKKINKGKPNRGIQDCDGKGSNIGAQIVQISMEDRTG